MKRMLYSGVLVLGCLGSADAMLLPGGRCSAENSMPEAVTLKKLRSSYADYVRDNRIFVLSVPRCISDYVEIVEGDEGKSAAEYELFCAILAGNVEYASELLDDGISFITDYGRTPLMVAAECGSTDLVRALLDRGDIIHIDDKDNFGDTAIMLALRNGHRETASLLLEAGASVFEKVEGRVVISSIENAAGETAFLLAAADGYDDMLEYIYERGVDVNHKDIYGLNVLQHALTNRCFKTFARLIHMGVDPDVTDYNLGTLGDWIRAHQKEFNTDVCRLLMAYEEAFDRYITDWSRNPYRRTRALFWAVRERINECAIPLISMANLDAVDERGETVAMIAARTGNIEIMQQLMEAGIDLEQSNEGGQTLVMIALYNKQFEMANMLQENGANMQAIDRDGLSVEDYFRLLDGTDIQDEPPVGYHESFFAGADMQEADEPSVEDRGSFFTEREDEPAAESHSSFLGRRGMEESEDISRFFTGGMEESEDISSLLIGRRDNFELSSDESSDEGRGGFFQKHKRHKRRP